MAGGASERRTGDDNAVGIDADTATRLKKQQVESVYGGIQRKKTRN